MRQQKPNPIDALQHPAEWAEYNHEQGKHRAVKAALNKVAVWLILAFFLVFFLVNMKVIPVLLLAVAGSAVGYFFNKDLDKTHHQKLVELEQRALRPLVGN